MPSERGMTRRLMVLNGVPGDSAPAGPWQWIVGVDGGSETLRRWGMAAQCLVGDFDSTSRETLSWHETRGAKVVRFPVDKDQTDFELALNEVPTAPGSEIHLVGLTGGRADMSWMNLLILGKWVERGWFTFDHAGGLGGVLGSGELRIAAPEGTPAALIALVPKVEGVVSQGVRWPLQGETLLLGEGRGVSNALSASEWRLRVGSGSLLWLLEGVSRAGVEIEWLP